MRITLDKIGNFRKEGKFGRCDVEYTREGGKPSKRTLVAIGKTKDVISTLREEGAVGKDWEIKLETVEKDGETYYNWVGAEEVASKKAAAKSAYQAKSTYETPEERARKNLSICRQNALTNAVVFVTSKDGKATVDDVLLIAEKFAAFNIGEFDVTFNEEAEDPVPASKSKDDEDFEDDIPF